MIKAYNQVKLQKLYSSRISMYFRSTIKTRKISHCVNVSKGRPFCRLSDISKVSIVIQGLMMKGGLWVLLLASAACVQIVNSRRLLGSQKCTWGPSYWCSGLQQSSKCQATRHCIDKVWNSNPYPEDDDEVCTICKNMVKEARDQLQSNETQV